MISTSGRIVGNTGLLAVGDALNKAGALLLTSVLARRFAPEIFGAFMLAQVLTGVITPIADPGISQLLYRDVASDPSHVGRLATLAAVIRLSLLPLALGGTVLICRLFRYPAGLLAFITGIAFAALVSGLTQNYFSIFRATAQVHLETLTQAIRLVVVGATVVLLTALPMPPALLASSYLAGSMIVLASTAAIGRARCFTFNRPCFTGLGTFLRRALPLGLQSVVVITYQYTGSLVLAHVTSIAELGYFQAAARLTSSLNIVGTSVSVAAFPLFVSMWRQKDPALAAAYYRSIKYLLAVGLGVAAGTTVLAAKIVAFLYGSRFEHAIAPLRILVWSEALVFWGFISASLLLACDRRWELSIQAVATAVFGVAASVSMVYVWGVPGAATGMLSTEAFATGLLIWQLKRTGIALPRRLVRDVALGSVASCCMIIILFATSNLHLLVQVVLGALTYGVVLCALGYFDTYDIARLSNILGFRRSTGLIQR